MTAGNTPGPTVVAAAGPPVRGIAAGSGAASFHVGVPV